MKGGSFDAELWRAQHNTDALEGDNPQNDMVGVLERDFLKPEMSREEVRELLGPLSMMRPTATPISWGGRHMGLGTSSSWSNVRWES